MPAGQIKGTGEVGFTSAPTAGKLTALSSPTLSSPAGGQQDGPPAHYERNVVNTKVLFLCTGNCCRSQMAEALLRHIDSERFEALSAGLYPAGYVHPLVDTVAEQWGVSIGDQHSKSWDEFADTPVDVIITLCDDVAQEACPAWPGTPLTTHWGLPDPTFHPGTPQEQLQFALAVFSRLRAKIETLVKLDFDGTDPRDLKAELDRIGET